MFVLAFTAAARHPARCQIAPKSANYIVAVGLGQPVPLLPRACVTTRLLLGYLMWAARTRRKQQLPPVMSIVTDDI